MIQYTCPKCGADVETVCLTVMPPIYKTVCRQCDWSYEEKVEIQRVPFPVNDIAITNISIPDSCKRCSNHPSNGGSGVCHCTLGGLKITC